MMMDSNSFDDDNELVLTAFHAAPLAYEDVNGNSNEIKILDLDKEEIALRQTLEKKGIRLKIKTATSKTLGNFLSKGSKLLHFSGHGNPKYLFIENGYGGGQKLHVNEDLKSWIRAGGNNLKFVFVAACCSRKAGDVFVEAGVNHVVCAEQDEQLLSHVAATVFAEEFYGALANGSTVQEAYTLASFGVVNSYAVRQTGLDPKEEAKKFILLPQGGPHDIKLFPDPKKVKREIPLKTYRSKPSLMPFPPKPFVAREMEMYVVLKSMIVSEERLVTVTGAQGVGKKSFCAALGHYMGKRKLWGDVYWIPSPRRDDISDIGCLLSKVMTILRRHSRADTLLEDEEYQNVVVRIFELLYEKQAVVIIDATTFNDVTSMGLLSLFLYDLFDKTKQVKLIVYHYEEARLVPPTTGFPSCRGTHIPLTSLDFNSTLVLFSRNCHHASPTTWSPDEMYNRWNQYRDTVSKVLGGGIPTKTVILAREMNKTEYMKLVDPSVPINESDFSRVLNYLSNCSSKVKPSFMPIKTKNSSIPPPVKSQKEVQARFGPLLRQDGKIFRKKKSAYIRPAVKWEKITTVIKGKQETQKTVDDDSSKIVCGAAGEYYVLTDEEFRDSYDEKSLKQIPASTKDEHLRELRQEGFCEYQSKRFVWGRVVTEEDMRFFRHGADSPDVAYFEAPWNESERVEKGDYIVTQYPTHGKRNDGVYRIELGVFKKTYVDTQEEADAPTINCCNIGYWSSYVAVGIAGLSITAALNQQMSMLVVMNICLVSLLLFVQGCWLKKQL